MNTPRDMAPKGWLRLLKAATPGVSRWICFPHAGGGAGFFRDWSGLLPPGIELYGVQYPGREDRIFEPGVADIAEAGDRAAEAIHRLWDRPLCLFGHSLGAALAFETAQRLEQRTGGVELTVVASGRPAPQRDRGGALHRASDQHLIDEILTLGATPPEVFEHAELRHLILSILRSDYRLSETYRPSAEPLRRTPILACRGETDPDVTPDEAGAWRSATLADFDLVTLPGDHFYLRSRAAELITAIQTFTNRSVHRSAPHRLTQSPHPGG